MPFEVGWHQKLAEASATPNLGEHVACLAWQIFSSKEQLKCFRRSHLAIVLKGNLHDLSACICQQFPLRKRSLGKPRRQSSLRFHVHHWQTITVTVNHWFGSPRSWWYQLPLVSSRKVGGSKPLALTDPCLVEVSKPVPKVPVPIAWLR